jgi:hypothetical protein
MSISPGNSAPPLPHRILAVKAKPAAVISATTDKSGSEREGSTLPSVPEGTAPKASTSLQTNALAARPAPAAPAAWPDVLPTVATVGASEPSAVLADASAESIGPKTDTEEPDGAESTARGGQRTVNTGITAAPMVLALALGLVAAGAVTRVVMKIAAARRAILMIGHPEADGVDDQWQPGRPNGQEHGFVDELQEGEAVTSAASNYESPHPSHAGDEWPEHSLGGGTSRMNEISDDTLAQLSRDLHKALLADGSWPRNMTARAHEARRHGAAGAARGKRVAGGVRSHAS